MEHRAERQLRLTVTVFLTLQHKVVLGGKLGSLHSHSCSIEVEVSPLQGDTIPFAEIETEIKAQITPLDNRTLNDLANFQGINPTVENFAAHLFNRLSAIAAEYGATLFSVTVRESPTRAVKYLRETPYAAAGSWDSDDTEDPGDDIRRLPVSPPRDREIDAVRRLRTPVQEMPLSPHQRPASDFDPVQPSTPPEVPGEQPGQAPSPPSQSPLPKTAAASAATGPAQSAAPEPGAMERRPKSKAAEVQHRAQKQEVEPAPQPYDQEFADLDYPPEPDEDGERGGSTSASLPPRKARKHAAPKPAAKPSHEQEGGREQKPAGRKLAASAVAPAVVSIAGPAEKHAATSPLSSRASTRITSRKASFEQDEPEAPRRWFALVTGLTLLAFLGATAFLYRKILWPAPGQGFPWGSDTWGHIQKAQFLLREILNKNYFPCFSPMWYNGVEPFRYWAPLPYYLLAGIMRVLGDPFLAAGWYVALCALIGGAGWLLTKDRLGPVGSVLAGFVWLFWQDNVRVAMSEGNLPRTLAIAVFPYLLHSFLLVVERPHERNAGRLAALAVVSSVAILAHAMIAATYFIGLTVMGALWALWMGTKANSVLRGVVGIFTGIGLSAWWLVPSLQSGLVSVDKAAVSESMQYFPISTSMNPYLRLRQPEIFYWGLSLAAVTAMIIVTWKRRTRLSQSAIFAGALFVAISTPTLKPLYSSVPMSYLIFPLYMATVTSGILILAGFGWKKAPGETRREVLLKASISALVALILAIDAYPSIGLVSTRTEPAFLKDVSKHLPSGGWREATLDLSRFGSAATYILGLESNREQVYGWAWQGATTASNIVGLNTAAESDFYPYLVDRLVEMGATDIVARRGVMDEVMFVAEAKKLGFNEEWRSAEAIVLSTPGGPYALKTDYQGIVIGKFAPNWIKLFPAMAEGTYDQVDKYTYADLQPYQAIIISGAKWEDRTKAEDLVGKLASAGKRILIDLEGLPEDVLSKRPVFMGVTGEPILMYRAPELFKPGDPKPIGSLLSFSDEHYPWKALSPQGMDVTTYQFPYLGEDVAVLGSRETSGGIVWYIGANLAYHAYLTRDRLALDIISKVVGIAPGAVPTRTKVWMSQYSASAKGYSFNLDVPAAVAGPALTIPVASRDNMVVTVDGVQVKYSSLHNLLSVSLDPGLRSVAIIPRFPSSMRSGAWVSLGCLAFIVLAWLSQVTARVLVSSRKQAVLE